MERNLNKTSHGLAKEAVENSIDKIWIDKTPQCISDTITLKLLTLVI